jgi:hypothetical protein
MSEQTEKIFNEKIKSQGYRIEKFYSFIENANKKRIPKRNYRIFYNEKEIFICRAFKEAKSFLKCKILNFGNIENQVFGDVFKPRKEFNRKFIVYRENY